MAKSKKRTVEPDLTEDADADIEVTAAAESEIADDEAEDLTDETASVDEEVPAEEGGGDEEVAESDLDEEAADDSENSIPEIIAPTLALLGSPALLEGEDEDAYNDLLVRVSETVKPADIIEEILVRDFVDQAWDVLRYRRLKAQLIAVNMHLGLKQVLGRLCDLFETGQLIDGWNRKDENTVEAVEEILESAEISMDQVHAVTLSMIIDDVERIDHLLMHAESRRNGVIKEVGRHRYALGQNLRLASDNVVDGECAEINPKRIEKQSSE